MSITILVICIKLLIIGMLKAIFYHGKSILLYPSGGIIGYFIGYWFLI